MVVSGVDEVYWVGVKDYDLSESWCDIVTSSFVIHHYHRSYLAT